MTTTNNNTNETTTMPRSKSNTTTLDEALAVLEQARQAAAEAEEEAREAQAAADARRTEALEDYDRQLLADYSEEDLDADVEAARQRLIAAVESDPVYSALADLAEVTGLAYCQWAQADAGALQLGVDTLPAGRSPAGDLTFELLLRHMALVAAERTRATAEALSASAPPPATPPPPRVRDAAA